MYFCNMFKLVCCLAFIIFSMFSFSQENPNSNAIQTSIKVRALQEKKAKLSLDYLNLDGTQIFAKKGGQKWAIKAEKKVKQAIC